MGKKVKAPWEEVFSVFCPHPRCREMIEVPGCFRGEGLCNCHALKTTVQWHDERTPELKIAELISFRNRSLTQS